jgi:hypothetical protein
VSFLSILRDRISVGDDCILNLVTAGENNPSYVSIESRTGDGSGN